MNRHIIELRNIAKEYDATRVLDGINLYIKENEFLTILGPSGCGKTTTLRIIGGFEQPTSGEVHFEGNVINGLPPYKRQINTVFQKYALFPHMDIYENIAFGLRIKKMPEKLIQEKVERMLRLVNLKGFEKRSIDSLSGGQQQRIAIARALVNEPKVLLLDEPLGALDHKLRKEMQRELKQMQQELGITFIYVTHDQEEALTMSDTVVVMDRGEVQQMGSPQDIYNEPKNRFVANFIGESNIIEGTMMCDYEVEFSGHKFKCVDSGFGEDAPVDIVVRPEDLKITDTEKGMIRGKVISEIFKGVHYEMLVDCEGFEWLMHNTVRVECGQSIGLRIDPEDIHIMKRSQS